MNKSQAKRANNKFHRPFHFQYSHYTPSIKKGLLLLMAAGSLTLAPEVYTFNLLS